MSEDIKIKKLAKNLVMITLDEEGKIIQSEMEKLISGLIETQPSGLKKLLKLILNETKRLEYGYSAVVEFNGKSDQRIVDNLVQKLDTLTDGKVELKIVETPTIIAGYRVRIGDDVIEDSIASRLSNLNKSFQ